MKRHWWSLVVPQLLPFWSVSLDASTDKTVLKVPLEIQSKNQVQEKKYDQMPQATEKMPQPLGCWSILIRLAFRTY